MNNSTAAATRPTWNPKKGTTSNPTKGRVHTQTAMASNMSSKWQLNLFNMI